MKKPLIGLTTQRFISKSDKLPGVLKTFVNEDYLEAIERAQGIPFALHSTRSLEVLQEYVNICDGFLITGGRDVCPLLYKKQPSHRCGEFDKHVDEINIKLIKLALMANKPILGICRGAQLINIACNGTLYQDIDSELGDIAHGHSFSYIKSDEAHSVIINENTKLHRILETNMTHVNSIHHQAINKLGDDCIVSARSVDGIIEGIEIPSKRFVLGLQWHPEMLINTNYKMIKIFEAFIESCE